MNPNYILGFLWGCALTLILFMLFINASIENTEKKVHRAYMEGWVDRDRECRVDN